MGILSMLLGNCRESDRGMGQKLNMSGGAVRARRQKMEDAGIITRYVVKVEPPLLGYGVLYVVVAGQDTKEILGQCRLIGQAVHGSTVRGGDNRVWCCSIW